MYDSIFLHKVIYSKSPSYLFNKLSFSRSLRTQTLNIPENKTLARGNSFLVRSVRNWNSLNPTLRRQRNTVSFKRCYMRDLTHQWGVLGFLGWCGNSSGSIFGFLRQTDDNGIQLMFWLVFHYYYFILFFDKLSLLSLEFTFIIKYKAEWPSVAQKGYALFYICII
jgi:hypothetical protein